MPIRPTGIAQFDIDPSLYSRRKHESIKTYYYYDSVAKIPPRALIFKVASTSSPFPRRVLSFTLHHHGTRLINSHPITPAQTIVSVEFITERTQVCHWLTLSTLPSQKSNLPRYLVTSYQEPKGLPPVLLPSRLPPPSSSSRPLPPSWRP